MSGVSKGSKGSNFAKRMMSQRQVPEGLFFSEENPVKASKLNPGSSPHSSPHSSPSGAGSTKADLAKPVLSKALPPRSLSRAATDLRAKDPPRSSKGKESSLSSDEMSFKIPKHLSRVVELLVKGVSLEEEKRCAHVSPLSLAEETALKSLTAAHSALKLNDRVDFQRGQALIHEEKCASSLQRLKKVEWELNNAKTSITNLEQLVAKKDADLKKGEGLDKKIQELTKRNQELEEEVKRKDQVFSSSLGSFEQEVIDLRNALNSEKAKVLNYQNSQKVLKDFADEQYTAGVEAATAEFKSKLPDVDWSFLDEPMDESPAAVTADPETPAPASDPPVELTQDPESSTAKDL